MYWCLDFISAWSTHLQMSLKWSIVLFIFYRKKICKLSMLLLKIINLTSISHRQKRRLKNVLPYILCYGQVMSLLIKTNFFCSTNWGRKGKIQLALEQFCSTHHQNIHYRNELRVFKKSPNNLKRFGRYTVCIFVVIFHKWFIHEELRWNYYNSAW